MRDAVLEREKLIEKVGLYFERKNDLPPLGARVFALLLLSNETGNTFDEIVELSKSSKGAVSTNINLLLQNGSIEYFTKCGERKRYFRLSKNYLILRLKDRESETIQELDNLHRIEEFNAKYNPQRYEQNKEFTKVYRDYLSDSRKILENLVEKLNELEKNHR